MNIKKLILFLSALGVIEINPQDYFADPEVLNRLRYNLTILTTDSFEGREAATRGEDSAAHFISGK